MHCAYTTSGVSSCRERKARRKSFTRFLTEALGHGGWKKSCLMMPRWSVVGIMSIASLADIFLPRDPILRFSGTMCHSQYPEGRTSRYERNVVWKSPQINSSVSFSTESIKFMVFCNPKDAAIRFSLKSFAKAASCLFVIQNRIKKLVLGLGHKADIHGAKRFSASSITS